MTPASRRIPLASRGVTLHVIDWGGDGTPLLLLHGLSSSARIWDLAAPLLTGRFRVVAADQRSHGLSDRPADGYGFSDTTADTVALIEALALDRPVLVGHSWGASVALTTAAAHAGAVRGVVLVDGGFIDIGSHLTWEEAERRMRPPDIDGAPESRFRAFMRQWPGLKDSWTPQVEEIVMANFDVRDGRVYRRLSVADHMKIAHAIWALRLGELLPRVRCPALAISAEREPHSEEDAAWLRFRETGLARFQQALPHAHVVRLPDTVHDVPLQRPLELAGLIADFAGSLR